MLILFITVKVQVFFYLTSYFKNEFLNILIALGDILKEQKTNIKKFS